MFHIDFEIIKMEKWNWNLTMDIPLTGPDLVHYFQLNWNSECWFLWREEIWRKTLRARMRANNKLNPQVTQRSGIKPRSQWWEPSTLSTVPSLQAILVVHYTCYIFWKHLLRQSTFFLACKQKLQSISVAEHKTWLK